MDQYQNAEYVLNGVSEEQPEEPKVEGPAQETVYEEEDEESTLDLAGVLDELLAGSDDSETDE